MSMAHPAQEELHPPPLSSVILHSRVRTPNDPAKLTMRQGSSPGYEVKHVEGRRESPRCVFVNSRVVTYTVIVFSF